MMHHLQQNTAPNYQMYPSLTMTLYPNQIDANSKQPLPIMTQIPLADRETIVTLTPTTTTPTTTTTNLNSINNLHRLRNKNLTRLNRIKYDSELLLHYLYDRYGNSNTTAGDYHSNVNIIKVCKVKVTRTCGTLLAHYYAKIEISNGYKFEFHPGSQPRTFQHVHNDGNIIMVLVYCDGCCKNELRSFVEGENNFNVAFRNCESILCKRKSMQTIFVSMSLLIIALNMFKFSLYYIFFVFFILILLYLNNNYIISNPRVTFCPHMRHNQYNASQYDIDK
ncbi:ORF-64 [Buzura suppressaria nucleopolyhedrovirus]|uniref:ORF-64 n=1 Tax=Buzura suppressaria nuclear polyhedrosis virus TaxID=74320 RepID=W5VKL7_NPVBS|nr:ORF-64 [Buzura suppressaria nucleopolyhedrovirus]AHH82653.1 ORF-64 [Buzura suppressaria nucleopolyhedrovirus]